MLVGFPVRVELRLRLGIVYRRQVDAAVLLVILAAI
jgi:hypothetical protein